MEYLNYNKFRFYRALFVFLIIYDVFSGTINAVFPFLKVLNFLTSSVTNALEAMIFMAVLNMYYGGEVSVLLRTVTMYALAILGVLFMVGGIVI